jgi:hypothetical protein
MRRDGVRRPRAWLRKSGTRAASGLPPGPLRVPARSWLKARSAQRCATGRTKAGPDAEQDSANEHALLSAGVWRIFLMRYRFAT